MHEALAIVHERTGQQLESTATAAERVLSHLRSVSICGVIVSVSVLIVRRCRGVRIPVEGQHLWPANMICILFNITEYEAESQRY